MVTVVENLGSAWKSQTTKAEEVELAIAVVVVDSRVLLLLLYLSDGVEQERRWSAVLSWGGRAIVR